MINIIFSLQVESLENQLKEAQITLQETQGKLEKLQAEHKQAVEKVALVVRFLKRYAFIFPN